MKIVIGADHNGLKLKNTLKGYLQERGAEVTDAGVYTEEPVDYPDIAWKVAEAVAAGTYDRGILICGTGIGMSIVANKVPGIRAASVQTRIRQSGLSRVMTPKLLLLAHW